jgi:hypothetical protein
MRPDPSEAKQRSVILHRMLFTCSWKHWQLLWCIQNAMIYDLFETQIWKQLWLLCRAVWDFDSSWNVCTALQKTWCHFLIAVIVRVPLPHGISAMILFFTPVQGIAPSKYDMHYLCKSIYRNTYGQTANRQYQSLIWWVSGDTDWNNIEMHLDAIVRGISDSLHHGHSVCQGEASL